MGVMECSRNGCENILCRKYSSEFGYICEECFNEMKISGVDIATFMATKKNGEKKYSYDKEFDIERW